MLVVTNSRRCYTYRMALAETTRHTIRTVINTIAGSTKVHIYLFGSQARGDHRFGSDIDIGVERLDGKPLPPGLLTDIQDAVQDSNLVERVDVVDCAKVSKRFHDKAFERAHPI